MAGRVGVQGRSRPERTATGTAGRPHAVDREKSSQILHEWDVPNALYGDVVVSGRSYACSMTQPMKVPQTPEEPFSSLSAAARELDAAMTGVNGLVEGIRMARAIQARVEAWICQASAMLADVLDHSLMDDFGRVTAAAEEISMALGITRRAAERYITVGQATERQMQGLGEELHSGRIGLDKAWAVADAIGMDTPFPVVAAVEERVLPRAPHRTPSELRRDVARALIEVDPQDADTRQQRAAAKRCVGRPRPEPHGMASMRLMLPALDAVTIDQALDAAANAARLHKDPRTHGQLRADTLTDWAAELLREGWDTPAGPLADGTECPSYRVGPVPSAIKVTVPLEVLARALPDWDPHPSPADLHSGVLEAAPAGMPAEGAGAGDAGAEAGSAGNAGAAGPRGTNCEPSARSPHSLSAANGTESSQSRSVPSKATGSAGSSGVPSKATGSAGSSGVPSKATGSAGSIGTQSEPVAGRTEAAWLEGYGPIAPAVAILLAAGGTWKRIVTDPLTGAPMDIGRASYRPPTHIAEAVRQREPVCVRPGCGMPSRRCDLDHVVEWQDGGETSLANLAPLCSRCHRLKSLKGGREGPYEPDGSRQWISFTGRTATRLPEQLPRERRGIPNVGRTLPGSGAHAGGGSGVQPDDSPPF